MGPHLGQNPVAQVAHGTTHGYQNLKDSSLNSQFVPFKKEEEKEKTPSLAVFATETPRPAPSTRSASGRPAPPPPLGLDLPTTASDGRHIHSAPDLSSILQCSSISSRPPGPRPPPIR